MIRPFLKGTATELGHRECFLGVSTGGDTISYLHLAHWMQCALSKFADDPQLGKETYQDTGGFFHSEGHPEAGRMGCQKLHKHSPAFGKEQPQNS